jgi:hypothetical protein
MTATHIRQSEFATRHNLRPVQIKAVRDKCLSADEWYAEGRVIYWTEEAAARVGEILSSRARVTMPVTELETDFGIIHRLESNPQSATQSNDLPETVECRGLKLCPNANFLYAVAGDEKIVVRAGKRFAHRLTGKTFQARIVREGDETTYIYGP